MKSRYKAKVLLGLTGLSGVIPHLSHGDDVHELSGLPVFAGVSEGIVGKGYEQLTERLEREVRVDIQRRGGTRYQTDLVIRGGIFEGSGLAIGGLAMFDPQTGHYFGEIPLDPGFFERAELWLGVSNGFEGFNSTAGTVNWEWRPILEGGNLRLSAGTDNLFGANARVGGAIGKDGGFEVAVGSEQGDGSIANGDFDLWRASGRLEFALGAGTFRVFSGYTKKFYGWPAMYTGFATLNETEDYEIALVGFDFSVEAGEWSHQIGGYWRQLKDDYEFNRSQPNNFFEHETRVYSLQGRGDWESGDWNLGYRWVVVADDLVSSTSLTNGTFDKREYGKVGLIAGKTIAASESSEIDIYGGASLDTTNEDATVGNPFAGMRWKQYSAGFEQSFYAEYSRASQVPGYTVLKSGPSGLFGGNAALGREKSTTYEGGYAFAKGDVSGRAVVFFRQDDGLADWVFNSASPNARQAAAMDSDTFGVELMGRWESESVAFQTSYAFLDKDATYRSAQVDASFYALNYARHRVMVSAEYLIADRVLLRGETEWREQAANALRRGRDDALILNAYVEIRAFPFEGWNVQLRGDNLTDEEFQYLPGTPGPGMEASVTVEYAF